MRYFIRFSAMAALLLISIAVFPQSGKVWVTIPDTSDVPYLNADQLLVSNDSVFQQYIQSLSIISSRKVFPASRWKELQQVYELECMCSQNDLRNVLSQSVPSLTGIENAPVYDTLHTPNDYNLSLGVNNYALALIQAEQAWDITKGDTNVVISVCDQDYSPNHSELLGKYVHLYQGGFTPTHGNAVSILAAGNTNNNNGLSSIGYKCRLGLYGMNYNEVLAAAYAGARVINISWASSCFFNAYEQLCVNEAYSTGAFLVAAAGNGATCGGAWNYVYPAAYANVFAITSIGQNDNHIQFGNDTTSTHQHNDKVDLSAPGYNVAVNPAEGWYINSSGTSYAAPYVSGTIGLMLSANPCLSRKDIDTLLRISSVNIDSLNPIFAGKIGTGRLNAYSAVQLAQGWATQPMAVTQQPATTSVAPGGNAQFVVSSTSSFPLYQWQYDSLGIYVNLMNNATYSGVKSPTLTITNAPLTLNSTQYRCVMTSGYCQAITNAATLNVTNTIIFPDSAGPILQPTHICLGDTITFNIAPVNNATGYNWTVTGFSSIISGQNTTSINLVVTDTLFTVSVTPINSYGSGGSSSTTVQLGPIATASFLSGATICSGDSALLTLNLTGVAPWNGLINGSIPFSTTISPALITVSPSISTDYFVTELNAGGCPGFPDYFSTMATVTVVQAVYDTVIQSVCSSQLPYIWNNQQIMAPGFYNDTVVVSGSCDSIVTLQLSVIAGNTPAAPATITQVLVNNTCFTRIYRYTAALTANATGYQWIIPSTCGGIGPVTVDSGDINSSRVIRLKYVSNAAAFSTDSIRVRAFNNCGFGSFRSVKLINTVLNVPARPTGITVTPLVTNVCGQRKYRYAAPALTIGNATTAAATGWLWSFSSPLPLLAQIDSGSLTSQVIVVRYLSDMASALTDSIFVQYTTACGNTQKRGLRINLNALTPPATPSTITITTLNNNTCGNRRYRLAMPTFPLAGNGQIQANGYLWSFTGNLAMYGQVDSGNINSRVIILKYTSQQGTVLGDLVRAQYTSNCGPSTLRTIKLSISNLAPPPAPGFITVTAITPTLCGNRIYRFSTAALFAGTNIQPPATGYEWSFTGNLGLNAQLDSGSLSGNTIRMKFTSNAGAQIGDSVKVRFTSSCGNGAYRSIKLSLSALTGCPQPTQREESLMEVFDAEAFPNPTAGSFSLRLIGSEDDVHIRIWDAAGRAVYNYQTAGNRTIELGDQLQAGVYGIELLQGAQRRWLRIIKY